MMYSSQWFITVFAHSLPFELVVRVWDVFLSEGYKIIFRIGIALMMEAEGVCMCTCVNWSYVQV